MTTHYQLPRSSPEAEGISSSAILAFVEAVEKHAAPLDALHGMMLLRHGSVVAEGWWAPYGPQHPHSLYSLSKSFTSTAIGLAVSEGRLSVDDPVLKFFPADAPAQPSDHLKAMRVRHLLSMNTGHHEDTTGHVFSEKDDNWPKTFLSLRVEHEPGSWFVYNTAATYMLSAIITRLTGISLLEYLQPRLFEPLGIEGATWETDPRGINIGGSGLHIKTEDIARFGLMYLRKGMFNGKRIVPEGWIGEATSAHSDNSNTQTNPDWIQGYGYQFWRCQHGAYRGDGAFGQYCIVMQDQDAVLAINSGVKDMQHVLDLVWEHLLPAMQPAALPANPQAHDALCNKLKSMSLQTVPGQATSALAAGISGKTYLLAQNEFKVQTVSLTLSPTGSRMLVKDDHGEHALSAGYGTWLKGQTDLLGRGGELPVVASGAWTSEDVYELRMCFYESEYCPTFTFHFSKDELQLQVEGNVSFGPTSFPPMTGHVMAS
jgi:CubicO group peptidase (beta-lactamase class C family)